MRATNERKFKVGDRVKRDSDGCTGTVVHTEFHREPGSKAPYWVRVRWDRNGSRSDREEIGLSLLDVSAA